MQDYSGSAATSLFLSRAGTLLRRYTPPAYRLCLHRNAVGIKRKATAHSFRHACATGMLEGGASVRHVQERLRRAAITTTQVYTHLAKADPEAAGRIGRGCKSRFGVAGVTGAPEFKQRMLALAEAALKKFAQQFPLGDKLQQAGNVRSRCEKGRLEAYGIKGRDLPKLSKGHPAKGAIAAEVRARTSVPRAWVTENLGKWTPGNIKIRVPRHAGETERSKGFRRQHKKFLSTIGSG